MSVKLKVDNLHKRYGKVQALNGVSFQAEAGALQAKRDGNLHSQVPIVKDGAVPAGLLSEL